MLLRNSVLAAASHLGCACKKCSEENCPEKLISFFQKDKLRKKKTKLINAVLQRHFMSIPFVSLCNIKITSAEKEFNFALCCSVLNMFEVYVKAARLQTTVQKLYSPKLRSAVSNTSIDVL